MSALEAHGVYGPSAEEETARLFDVHSEEILAFCRRQLGSRADADDALQTTFLYVLRALRRGVVPECEAAWLTTIAKNVCRTQRRALGRRGALAIDLDLDRIALAEPEPDEAELLAALREALASLPDSQRNAIVMREWLGLRPAEIATRLELTTPATNALLTRARHSLAGALTASVRGPLAVLDVGMLAHALRGYLKSILGSAASKTAVVIAAATASVGGVVAQQSLADDGARPARMPITEQASPVATATTPQARSSMRALSPAAASPVEPATATQPRQPVPTTDSKPADPTTASTPVEPVERSAPVAQTTPSAGAPEKHAGPDPEPVPVPELPRLPDLSAEDPPPAPVVELPPLPPVEVPQLPPLPPLPPLLP